MKQQGKFILFEKIDEFTDWLKNYRVTRSITLIQNHHTWLPDYKTFNGKNHFQLLASMEQAHKERGFAQIAQNLTTFPDGTLAVCRSINTIPAGIKGANTPGICIEHVGNFDAGKDAMNQNHRDIIVALNAALCKKLKLTPGTDTIVYHAWYNLSTGLRDNDDGTKAGDRDHKTCPGTAFFGGNTATAAASNFIPLIRERLA